MRQLGGRKIGRQRTNCALPPCLKCDRLTLRKGARPRGSGTPFGRIAPFRASPNPEQLLGTPDLARHGQELSPCCSRLSAAICRSTIEFCQLPAGHIGRIAFDAIAAWIDSKRCSQATSMADAA